MKERLGSLNEVCEGVAGVKNHTKNVVFLHQKCPYLFDLIKWFRKKADLPTYYEDWGFF